MTAPASLRQSTYAVETYSAGSWIATEDWVEHNYSAGWFSGGDIPDTFHPLGAEPIRLNVPLCNGCDKPIQNDCCDDCEVVFVHPDPQVKQLPNGRWEVRA